MSKEIEKKQAIEHLEKTKLANEICLMLSSKNFEFSISVLRYTEHRVREDSKFFISKESLDNHYETQKRNVEHQFNFTYSPEE